MKGAGKIFCVLMLALQPMLAAGCASGETGETLSLPEGYRSLFNFEEYAEFGGVMQKNYFGKYSINTDGRYVKNGVGSAKLEPCGEGYADPYSRPALVMYPAKIAAENADFSKAERVVFDLYNTSDESKVCYFSLGVASSGDVLETDLRPASESLEQMRV